MTHPGWIEVERELATTSTPRLFASARTIDPNADRWTVMPATFQGHCPHCRRYKMHVHTFLVHLRIREQVPA